MSSSQVYALYSDGRTAALPTANMIFGYNMQEGTGTNLVDVGPNSYTGYLAETWSWGDQVDTQPMTLISQPSAMETYTAGLGMLAISNATAGITNNVDWQFWASANNGTNWAALTLTSNTPPITLNGYSIMLGTNTSLGAASGSTVRVKLTTTNKSVAVQGWSVGLN
jgi:hypothetical protein